MKVKILECDLNKLLNSLNKRSFYCKNEIKKELLSKIQKKAIKRRRKRKICRSVLYISDSSDDEFT